MRRVLQFRRCRGVITSSRYILPGKTERQRVYTGKALGPEDASRHCILCFHTTAEVPAKMYEQYVRKEVSGFSNGN